MAVEIKQEPDRTRSAVVTIIFTVFALALGDAIIEVTEPPHTGCKKFTARFGVDAVVFVNSGRGKELNFRGINAKVVQSGDIKVGDAARKL